MKTASSELEAANKMVPKIDVAEGIEKHKEDHKFLQEAMEARKKALLELKKVSLPLYKKALELQPNLFPLDCRGPTETPPIPGYCPPEPDE